mgnify:CR=1 FL=1
MITVPSLSIRQKVKALQDHAGKLEKQLEDAQIKNAALKTIIDVAEITSPVQK